jgi:2-haloacid dehalogenase
MTYSTFLLDLDHTLLDSDASEAQAFRQTLLAAGIPDPENHVAAYRTINLDLWAAVERGEILPQQLKTRRFERLAIQQGFDVDAPQMANDFVAGLGANGDLYKGARDVLQQLSEQASLALLTNGLSEVQRARIERLDLEKYFDAIIISAEVSTAKPGTKIYDLTFEALGNPKKGMSLMVGDSLSSDIRGGTNYAIDTCWYNPKAKAKESTDQVTHEIRDLSELLSFVTV